MYDFVYDCLYINICENHKEVDKEVDKEVYKTLILIGNFTSTYSHHCSKFYTCNILWFLGLQTQRLGKITKKKETRIVKVLYFGLIY